MSSLNLPVGSAADVLTRLLRRFFLFLFSFPIPFLFFPFLRALHSWPAFSRGPVVSVFSLSSVPRSFLLDFLGVGPAFYEVWGYRSQSMLVCCFLNMIVFAKQTS